MVQLIRIVNVGGWGWDIFTMSHDPTLQAPQTPALTRVGWDNEHIFGRWFLHLHGLAAKHQEVQCLSEHCGGISGWHKRETCVGFEYSLQNYTSDITETVAIQKRIEMGFVCTWEQNRSRIWGTQIEGKLNIYTIFTSTNVKLRLRFVIHLTTSPLSDLPLKPSTDPYLSLIRRF